MHLPPRRVCLALAALACFARIASAELPAFTPNVVDPKGYLSEAERGAVNEVIREVRRAGISAAVFLTDRLGEDTTETLAERAFQRWQLGTRGRDDGLLLVLVMEDKKMRFEVGYGLEAVLTDLACKRALDEQLRPKLRARQTAEGIGDALYALARLKDPGFRIAGRTEPQSGPTFDAKAGGLVWGAWVLFIGWLIFGRRKFVFDSRVITFVFFSLNPGAFFFVGVALGWSHRAAVLAAVSGWGLAHLVLLPFYVLVALAVGYPVRLYARRARELGDALVARDPQLRALETRWRQVTGDRSVAFDGRAPSLVLAIVTVAVVLIASIVFGLDQRSPPWFLLPGALFVFAMRSGARKLAPLSSPEAYAAELEARIHRHEARMRELVDRGHATRRDDGSYAYTEAYYASSASSSSDSGSSSSSSSDSSSSGGGSSGGGGASSDW